MTHVRINKLHKTVLVVLAVLFLITSVNSSNSSAATSENSTTSATNKAVKPVQANANPVTKDQNTAEEELPTPNIAYPKSLFFTPEEISAIQRALLGVDTPDEDEGKPKPPRVLKLSGMIYNSPDNWVIWLNGKRITPDRLLPEIIDISVDGSKVHLKWFDYGINDVISITLRPHQTYDIETGILLPG